MNPYQIVSESVDNSKTKDSKTKKVVKRALLVGGTLATGHGIYKGKQEYNRMRLVFINLQNEIINQHGYEGLKMWKEFKKTSAYAVRKREAMINIAKHGTISGIVAFLLFGFYSWMKHHKIEKDLPRTISETNI